MAAEAQHEFIEVAIVDVDDAASWDRAIEAAQPARLLVAVERWLDGATRRHLSAEDLWQESLLVAWSRRATFRWQGLASFRRWLLEIAQHCAADARSRAATQKRGGGQRLLPLTAPGGLGSTASDMPLLASTTPSRLAQVAEQALVMRRALAALDDDVREVVRMRVFEEQSCEEVASQLGLGLSAVKHRARRGATEYERRLRVLLDSRDDRHGTT